MPCTHFGLSNGCNKPFFEIFQVVGMNQYKIYDNLGSEQVRWYSQDEGVIELKLPGKLRIFGNIMIVFKYSNSFAFSP